MSCKPPLTSDQHFASTKDDTFLVQILNKIFRHLGQWIAVTPWTFIIVTTLVTVCCSAIIPFTKLTNDVSDFTPYAARARSELQVYQDFFNKEGEPIAVFILITAKNNGSMLGIPQLREAVRLLDNVTNGISMKTKDGNLSLPFSKFCSSFCAFNEPIRHFYNGLLVLREYNDSLPPLLNLGYPETTVLGRRFFLDTNFFGVKVEIVDDDGQHKVISLNDVQSIAGVSVLDDTEKLIPNNVRDVKVVVIQLRAEKPASFTEDDVERYEFAIVDFLKKNLSSSYINAVVITPSYITSEIVRAGLSMIPCLLIGFIIMCAFSSATVTISATFMSQMNINKLILAIWACICPFMAVAAAFGTLFWLGVRFGTILCVTPFLVLAIGVDDSFLMINSWQKSTRTLRLYPERDIHGNLIVTDIGVRLGRTLEDVGPSITITTLTNVLAFGVGALTPTPEIRLFCIGNSIAMFVDFVYQITFFTAIMAIVGRKEVEEEKRMLECKFKIMENNDEKPNQFHRWLNDAIQRYCDAICSFPSVITVLLLLIIYWGVSIYGATKTHPELRPEIMFSADSELVKALKIRNDYITPYYSTCMVFVNNPGSIEDPANVQRLKLLVESFEKMPEALGRFSTKFWLRDYEEFVQDSEHVFEIDNINSTDTDVAIAKQAKQDLVKFLEWPEFRYWNGTIQYHFDSRGKVKLDRFFFMVSSHGDELRDWSNRAKLMHEWRQVADEFPEFEVSVYEDDAKFLDLIETMVTQTVQSSLCTLICMVLVCLLFIPHKTATITATFSILSTSIGVVGILSLWGTDLDPVVMSDIIMSIGFSVDIPAHVTYHFFKAEGTSVETRFHQCLSSIAFPVFQAAISTLICIASILWVELHMAIIFVKTMFLVVTIGLIHGLLVIPVLLKMTALLNGKVQPNTLQLSKGNTMHMIKVNLDSK